MRQRYDGGPIRINGKAEGRQRARRRRNCGGNCSRHGPIMKRDDVNGARIRIGLQGYEQPSLVDNPNLRRAAVGGSAASSQFQRGRAIHPFHVLSMNHELQPRTTFAAEAMAQVRSTQTRRATRSNVRTWGYLALAASALLVTAAG